MNERRQLMYIMIAVFAVSSTLSVLIGDFFNLFSLIGATILFTAGVILYARVDRRINLKEKRSEENRMG